jgi:COP9 signalosome complex subunit 6
MMEHNENPLFLLLNPDCGEKLKELPLQIYESKTMMAKDVPTTVFDNIPYEIVTHEAERVAVDHVAKVGIATEEGSVSKSGVYSHYQRAIHGVLTSSAFALCSVSSF